MTITRVPLARRFFDDSSAISTIEWDVKVIPSDASVTLSCDVIAASSCDDVVMLMCCDVMSCLVVAASVLCNMVLCAVTVVVSVNFVVMSVCDVTRGEWVSSVDGGGSSVDDAVRIKPAVGSFGGDVTSGCRVISSVTDSVRVVTNGSSAGDVDTVPAVSASVTVVTGVDIRGSAL